MGVEPWGLYPPEINAGRYETGVGFPTWIAAATEWTAFAGLVAEAIAAFGGQVGALTGNWTGVASGNFGAVSAPFSAWLAKMEQTAITNALTSWQVLQSYFLGLSTMVPLPIIIANRIAARTAQVACFLGAPNTEAVRLELEYAMYWVHNGAVMSVYDVAVNTATAFKPVPPPPPLVVGAPGGGAAAGGIEALAKQASTIGSTGARAAQSATSAGVNSAQQLSHAMLTGPSTRDQGLWSGLLGGGPSASDMGTSGGSGASMGGGGGGSAMTVPSMAPVTAPLASLTAKPVPISTTGSLGFSGVPNAPTTARPSMPMMPPIHPNSGSGKRSGTTVTTSPIMAAEQEFPIAPTRLSGSADNSTAEPAISKV